HDASVSTHLCSVVLFFFFQAEDGIRDWSVTGVQTCALPIWIARLVVHTDPHEQVAALGGYLQGRDTGNVVGVHLYSFGGAVRTRSEERRVGKEGRCRGGADE